MISARPCHPCSIAAFFAANIKRVYGSIPRAVASVTQIESRSLPLAVLIQLSFLYTQSQIDLVKWNDNQGLLPICGACAGPQLNRLRPQGGPDLDPHSPVAQVGEGAARGV